MAKVKEFIGKCKFCNKEIRNKGSLKSHEKRCKENPDRSVWVSGGFQWRSDPAYSEIVEAQKHSCASAMGCKEVREKISNSNKGKHFGKVAAETRKKWKENRKIGGLRHGAGRGKKGWYKGIWCDSTWELAFVVWHIDNNIPIQRNKESFLYSFNGEDHRYFPDFLVDNQQLYEIKAYVDERATIKITSCPKKINLITYGQIETYLTYAEQKANSKDLTVLYETALSQKVACKL